MLNRIEYEEQGIRIFHSGLVTSEELWEANEKAIEYLFKNHYRYQIFCFDDIEDFLISSGMMRKIAERDAEAFAQRPIEKIAVVTESQLVYGMVRMYSAFADDSSAATRIFDKLTDAEEWVLASE